MVLVASAGRSSYSPLCPCCRCCCSAAGRESLQERWGGVSIELGVREGEGERGEAGGEKEEGQGQHGAHGLLETVILLT